MWDVCCFYLFISFSLCVCLSLSFTLAVVEKLRGRVFIFRSANASTQILWPGWVTSLLSQCGCTILSSIRYESQEVSQFQISAIQTLRKLLGSLDSETTIYNRGVANHEISVVKTAKQLWGTRRDVDKIEWITVRETHLNFISNTRALQDQLTHDLVFYPPTNHPKLWCHSKRSM